MYKPPKSNFLRGFGAAFGLVLLVSCSIKAVISEVALVGSGEMFLSLLLFASFEESSDDFLPGFAVLFESDKAFFGLEVLLGAAFLLSDPPKRSDSISSKP